MALLAIPSVGCASSQPRRVIVTHTMPDARWEPAPGSPRSSYPTRLDYIPRTVQVASMRSGPLTREQVLALATRNDPGDAIAEIDRHPLAFPLDGANLAWFDDRLVAPE